MPTKSADRLSIIALQRDLPERKFFVPPNVWMEKSTAFTASRT
jgi:hypothetical protein